MFRNQTLYRRYNVIPSSAILSGSVASTSTLPAVLARAICGEYQTTSNLNLTDGYRHGQYRGCACELEFV
jgi:hypothetical protein